jgi:hypothetical protein
LTTLLNIISADIVRIELCDTERLNIVREDRLGDEEENGVD